MILKNFKTLLNTQIIHLHRRKDGAVDKPQQPRRKGLVTSIPKIYSLFQPPKRYFYYILFKLNKQPNCGKLDNSVLNLTIKTMF